MTSKTIVITGASDGIGAAAARTLAAAALAFAGYHNSRPLTRFRAWVINPIPASVHEVRVNRITSFGGPSGMIFRFFISDRDLPLLLTAHHLQSPRDLAERRAQWIRLMEAVNGALGI